MNSKVAQIWAARHFIKSSIRNEFMARVVRSRLGLIWIVLLPLAQAAIYAFVLSMFMQARFPGVQSEHAYPIYLMSGILAWSLFSDIVGRSLGVFIDNSNLIKKMAFPRLALPIAALGSAVLNNLLLLLAILLVFVVLGHNVIASLIWLPMLFGLMIFLAAGLGLTIGILNVFIRDVGQLVGIGLQFGFWLTPIVYTLDVMPATAQLVLSYNPLTAIVQAYQSVLVFGRAPDLSALVYPAVFAALAMLVAVFFYRRGIEEVVDAL